jgi:hypothetical protein
MVMTDANIPSKEQLENMDPDRDTVVYREDDDGVRFRFYTVSGLSVDETNARTYTRTFGHYFVDNDICEEIDRLISESKSEQSVISSFQRLPSEAYEVQIEVDSNISQMNVEFDRNKGVIEIPSHSQYVNLTDSILSDLEDSI